MNIFVLALYPKKDVRLCIFQNWSMPTYWVNIKQCLETRAITIW